jgi:hypothetical protein
VSPAWTTYVADAFGVADGLAVGLAVLDGMTVLDGRGVRLADSADDAVAEGLGDAGAPHPETARTIARPAARRRIGLNSG